MRRAIVVVAICLVALSALALVKLSKVTTHSEERVELRPGRRTVRHEKWAESNRIVQIRCEDPLVVSVDLFLTQPGMIHFLLEGKMTGESAVILEFASGDTKSIRVRVSSETPGKQPPLRQQDSIARAVELVHLGDRLYGDRHKEDQNWSRASASYDEALACFRQVPFFVFLPEYRTAIEKARTTELEWNGYYEQVWAEFEIAQTRNDVSAARKILERLLRIVTDPNDPRYLRNKTVMEFLYS